MLVDNGETLVLGGVFERTREFSKRQVPWLGDRPLISHLYQGHLPQRQQPRVLVFVTPKDPENGRRRTLP